MSMTAKNHTQVTTDETGANIHATVPLTISCIHVQNKTAGNAAAWVQLFNLPIGSVTVGTTVPLVSFPVAADTSATFTFNPPIEVRGPGVSVAVTAAMDTNGAADGRVTVWHGV